MRIAMTSKEKKEYVDRQEPFPSSCGKKAAKVGKNRGGARVRKKAPGESGAQSRDVVLTTRWSGSDLQVASV
jgi:hypothetical protein